MNKKVILTLVVLFLIGKESYCQKTGNKTPTIKLAPGNFEFQPGKVEFIEHKGVKSMKILANSGPVELKDYVFSNGTIEFDIDSLAGSPSIYFRQADKKEGELFYIRSGTAGNVYANDAVQYAPIVKGVNLWDLYDHYQGPAVIKKNEWNHVKLVVSGFQMRVYVNDMLKPTLEIPKLEGNSKQGSLVFDGPQIMGNLTIKPNEVEGLSANEGVDLTNHSANYIRQFLISQPVELPGGRELSRGDLPKTDSSFVNIAAEREGLINITRKYGKSNRQYVWLKAKINSDKERMVQMKLGFSDEVWVYVNNNLTYIDKNLYRDNMRKYPDGRISIENSQFPIRFNSGVNEILIGVSNDFFGWGIIARLESMEGLSFSKR